MEELWLDANTFTEAWAFDWTTDESPPAGKLTLDLGWVLGANTLFVNEVAADGSALSFSLMDQAFLANDQISIVLRTVDRTALCRVAGVSNDEGAYRSVPVITDDLVGAEPANNAPLSLRVSFRPQGS
jgi:hypothetical protein